MKNLFSFCLIASFLLCSGAFASNKGEATSIILLKIKNADEFDYEKLYPVFVEAFRKKNVPATLTRNDQGIDYILNTRYWVKDPDSSAPTIGFDVLLYDAPGDNLLWKYSVDKVHGGFFNGWKSCAEAIAKHLKDEFLSRK